MPDPAPRDDPLRRALRGTRALRHELQLELGYLLADFAGRLPFLSANAATRDRMDPDDGAFRLDSGAPLRVDRGRDAHDAASMARAPRQRLCRAVPQHPAPGADVPLVFRAAGG